MVVVDEGGVFAREDPSVRAGGLGLPSRFDEPSPKGLLSSDLDFRFSCVDSSGAALF